MILQRTSCPIQFPNQLVLTLSSDHRVLDLLKECFNQQLPNLEHFQENKGFNVQHLPPPPKLPLSASSKLAVGDKAFKEESPHHRSCQSRTLLLSPLSNLVLAWHSVHPLLVAFHNRCPYPSIPSWEHHPPIFSPNLAEITCLLMVLLICYVSASFVHHFLNL